MAALGWSLDADRILFPARRAPLYCLPFLTSYSPLLSPCADLTFEPTTVTLLSSHFWIYYYYVTHLPFLIPRNTVVMLSPQIFGIAYF